MSKKVVGSNLTSGNTKFVPVSTDTGPEFDWYFTWGLILNK